MLLALDISTSIIGWSTWEKGSLQDQGFLKLSDSKGFPKELENRLDIALEFFRKFEGVTEVAAEAALQKFSGGKTNANTMNKLIAMNFALTYTLSRDFDATINLITVNKARALCSIKIPKQPRGKKRDANLAKKTVCRAIAEKYPMVTIEWTPGGNVRAGFDDMADAIVIGEAVHK